MGKKKLKCVSIRIVWVKVSKMISIEKVFLEIKRCGEGLNMDTSSLISGMMLNSKECLMPFSREMVCSSKCQGLRYNHGLFTQCSKDKKLGEYCKGCNEEGKKNGSGVPDSGNISSRLSLDLMEYIDGKGRGVIAFSKIMRKMKMSEEEVRKEASLKKYILDDRHFEVKAKVEKREKRGRPKKEKKEVESGNVKDLFAELIGEVDVVDDVVELVNELVVKENKPDKKELEKAEKEAKKESKKSEKEAEKEAKKAEKEAAKEAKKESNKLEKKEAKKTEKEAEKEAKKEAKKAEKKEAKKAAKKEAKKAENLAQPLPKVDLVQPLPDEEDRVKVTVTRFEFEGKQYLRSTENILYDPDSKEEMGIFCEETKSIKALPDGECEEEEYDNV
jgi:hypothetical protein